MDEGASPLGSDFGAQNRGEAPSPSSLRSSTSPRTRGEVGQALSFSRRPFAPELCKRSHVKRETGVEKKIEGWCLVVSLFATPVSPISSNERKKEAERRQALILIRRPSGGGAAPTLTLPRLRGRAWEGAARLSAFHHGSHTRDLLSQGSTRARLPATRPERPLRPPRACPSPVMHLTRRS